MGTKYEGGEWISSKCTDDSVETGGCELSYAKGMHHHHNGCHHGSGLLAGSSSSTAANSVEFGRFLVIR
jgi:hypothetical protein